MYEKQDILFCWKILTTTLGIWHLEGFCPSLKELNGDKILNRMIVPMHEHMKLAALY